jgi:hypothetical protein
VLAKKNDADDEAPSTSYQNSLELTIKYAQHTLPLLAHSMYHPCILSWRINGFWHRPACAMFVCLCPIERLMNRMFEGSGYTRLPDTSIFHLLTLRRLLILALFGFCSHMVTLWAGKACHEPESCMMLICRTIHASSHPWTHTTDLIVSVVLLVCVLVWLPGRRRKSKQVEAQLLELGMEGLEERLSSATQHPASPAYRLSRMISEVTQMEVQRVE